MLDGKLILTGKDLTLKQVIDVAKRGRKVAIDAQAAHKLQEARELVYELVDKGVPMYGCNTGVGWNKDVPVTKEFLGKFNSNLMHSHAVGVRPYASEEETRAALLIRLNTLLVGCTGISPHIPPMYAEMLNRGIHPLIPERGSVGQGDIGCLAHVGLALLGEGGVCYKGKTAPAIEALRAEGLEPVELGAKDGLAVVSSNALGAGQAAVMLHEAKELVQMAEVIYCLSLEGLGGNVTPLHLKTHKVHGFQASVASARQMAEYLEGSYLYQPREGRALQDPLCYRNGAHLYGTARQVLENAEQMLTVQFNHSDDNPSLLLEEREIISCSNFDSLPWVLELETISLVLSHLSKAACMRITRLANPAFTGLSRNLTPGADVIAFSTVQKTFSVLDAEIRLLANPCSMDTFSLSGDMEDVSANAPLVAQKLRKMLDNLRYIFAIEFIFSGQAIDLRDKKALGKGTCAAYTALREVVDFYSADDHTITEDIYEAYHLLKSGQIIKAAKADGISNL